MSKLVQKIRGVNNKIESSEVLGELVKGSAWSLLGAIISKGALFLSWVFVARILGKELYGQFGILRSTILMFVSFSGLSLGLTVSKHISQFLENQKERIPRLIGMVYTVGLFIAVVFTILLWIFSSEIARDYLSSIELSEELRLSSIILFFSSLNAINIGVLQGGMCFKKITIINLRQTFFSVPFFIVGALYWGVYGSIIAFMLSYIVTSIFSTYEVIKFFKVNSIVFDFKEFLVEKRILFTYSLPAFLSGLMVTPVKWYTESMLIKSSGFSQMGLFVAAMTFNTIIVMMINTVSAPFITVMSKNKDNRNVHLEKINILAPWFLGVVICLPLIFFPSFGALVFGKSFQGNLFDEVFLMILFITILMMFKQGLAHIIAVHNLQWWSLLSNAVWGGALICFFSLCEEKNALNLSKAYVFSYLINIVFLLPVYYRRKIIPRKTIELIEAFIIWGVLLVLSLLYRYTNISIYIRSILFVVTFIVVVFLFLKIYKKK